MPGGESARVLVVDDEPHVRGALARLVRGLGLTPVVAATAEEAVALCQGDTFRVVIADIHLPGMDGLAMLHQLSPLLPNARFVVVSSGASISVSALPRGHRSCVFGKPWPEAELAAAIRDERRGVHSSPPPPVAGVAPGKVLLIDDDSEDATLFQTALRLAYPGQFVVQHAKSIEHARQLVQESNFDVVALDLDLRDSQGLETISLFQSDAPNLGLVVLSGIDDPDLALQAVQAGAQDYLVKGKVGGSTLGRALRYAEQRKRTEMRLADLAFHDQLTGLANRTLFRQRIAETLARSRRRQSSFAILLIDIDRFKSINDALGHDAGDVFLNQLSERLRDATRETDTVARLGGDEFAILAEPVTGREDVERLAQRVLSALSQTIQIFGVSLTPSASLGAAIYPESGEDSDSLLAAADAAMYVVKGKGRNGFHLHAAQLSVEAEHRLLVEGELRQAVAEQRMILHYQPQVALDGSFLSAEALLRWRRRSGELVSAAEFMPILEESGLIIQLGPWIIRSACKQLADWRRGRCRVDRVAVNLSAKQFVANDLRAVLNSAVTDHGLTPKDVELELTETALLQDDEATARVLERLRQDGFRIALDDFGTGYCSLVALQRLPINGIKIDKSFVSEIATLPRRRDLVGGIVQLAKRLGIDVIAEGVESQAQLQALIEEGCTAVQGYLLGVPVAGEAFAAERARAARSAETRVAVSAN